jgi:uncharacterized protein (TIGR02246 family)
VKKLVSCADCNPGDGASSGRRPNQGGRRGRAIEASHREYIAAMKRGDAAALATYLTDEGILLPQNSDMQRGRATIEKWFATWLPTTAAQDFVVATENVTVVGSTASQGRLR